MYCNKISDELGMYESSTGYIFRNKGGDAT
jgi:hypothetical protein